MSGFGALSFSEMHRPETEIVGQRVYFLNLKYLAPYLEARLAYDRHMLSRSRHNDYQPSWLLRGK